MPKLDEYGDIPGQGGTKLATMETVLPEANLHVAGTRLEGDGWGGLRLSFFLYNPAYRRDSCRVRCGICKLPMDGYRHCPRCYPQAEVV